MLVYIIQYEDGTIKYDVFVTGIAGCLLVGTVQKKKKKKKGYGRITHFSNTHL